MVSGFRIFERSIEAWQKSVARACLLSRSYDRWGWSECHKRLWQVARSWCSTIVRRSDRLRASRNDSRHSKFLFMRPENKLEDTRVETVDGLELLRGVYCSSLQDVAASRRRTIASGTKG